ncbi:MAG: MFS transporter [Christensenellaceae bacterium]|jgi:Na+/melibiose symporter-like transporter|nr:MFS transporter [Christensenellaceae bacterium]
MSSDTFNVKISTKERLMFSLGDFFGGAGGLITAVYVVYLALNGLSPGYAALIVMLVRIWDAVNDPIMGILSDNTRTKWGRRRPYLFAGGILIVFSFALLFLPLYKLQNSNLKFVIYLVGYFVYSTVSTIIAVPYQAMLTEVTGDADERNKINTMRLIFSLVSSVVSAGVPMILIESLQKGKIGLEPFAYLMIFGFGSLYMIPLILCAVGTKERIDIPKEKMKFSFKAFIKPLKCKSFALLVIMYFTAFTCMDLITTNIIYVANYGLKFQFPSFLIIAIIMVSYAATIPFHNKMLKKKSKAYLFRLGIPLYIVGIIMLCLFPTNFPGFLVFPIAVIVGLGMGGCQLMPWYIFPEAVDLGELKFGERNAGSFSGIMTFIRTATSAIAIGISGWILELTGFKPPVADHITGLVEEFEQTDTAVWGLRLVIMVPVILLIGTAFFAASKLKISPERARLVSKALAVRNGGDPLTEEEEAELELVKKECL